MNYFTISELTFSATAQRLGIDNRPTPIERTHLEELTNTLLNPLREAWSLVCKKKNLGSPKILILSGFRCHDLNLKVGGSPTSAHLYGWAADLKPMNGELLAFKIFLKEWLLEKDFDQMISEKEDAQGRPRWIHLGLWHPTHIQRHEFLSMRHGKYFPMT